MNPTRWMSQLNQQLRINQIVMPGSHDAGVYGNSELVARLDENQQARPGYVAGHTGVTFTKKSKASWAICQFSNFGQQAMAGSRFFDLRIFVRELSGQKLDLKKLSTFDLRAGHFSKEGSRKKQPSFGAFGGSLPAILLDSCKFVLRNPTEFLILRFSHINNPDLVELCIRSFMVSNPNYDALIYKGGGNIAMKSVQNLAGHVVMVFDTKNFKGLTATDGFNTFHKYEDNNAPAVNGLATCGKFKSNPFTGALDMSGIQNRANTAIDTHSQHHVADHLQFVYWQQTGGAFTAKDVKATTQGKSGAQVKLSPFVNGLAAQYNFTSLIAKGSSLPVNVVSHDFVNSATCDQIIRLNPNVNWG